jgi:hypothetical protein
LHVCKSRLKLFLAPHVEHFFALFVLAQHDQLRNALHVVLDVDHDVDAVGDVLVLQRELSVAMERVLVGLVHVLEHVLELLEELHEDRPLEPLFELLQELLHALGLDGVGCQFVVQILAVLADARHRHAHGVDCALARDDQLEVVGMAQRDPVEVVQLALLGRECAVNEDLGLGVGLNEDAAAVVGDGAVTRHDAEHIEFDVVFFAFFGADLGLAFFDVVEEHAEQSGVFGDVHEVGQLAFIDVRLLRESCFFK